MTAVNRQQWPQPVSNASLVHLWYTDFSLLISKNTNHITPVNVRWIRPSLFHTLMVLSAEPVIMSPEVSWMADQTALWCPDNVIKGLVVPSNFHTQAVSSHEALNTVFSFKPAARLHTAMKRHQHFWLVNKQVDELCMTESKSLFWNYLWKHFDMHATYLYTTWHGLDSGAIKTVSDPPQDDTTAASTNFYCYV